MKIKRIGIIGRGDMGSEVEKQATAKGYETLFMRDTKGIYLPRSNRYELVGSNKDYMNYLEQVNALMLAIDSRDNGEAGLEFITQAVTRGIPVVTCEKAVLSNFFHEVKSKLNLIGYDASVGGGTLMLKMAREILYYHDASEIHAIQNASMNYIFSKISGGYSLEVAINAAKDLRLVEKGAKENLDIMNSEQKDALLKAVTTTNILGFGENRAVNINLNAITPEGLSRLVRLANNRRFITSISLVPLEEPDIIGGFNYRAGNWYVSAGFKKLNSKPVYSRLFIHNQNCSLSIKPTERSFGEIIFGGTGAGPKPTAAAMMDNLELLVKDKLE